MTTVRRPVVLIVDDREDTRQAYRLLLEAHDYEVLDVADALAAMDTLGRARVDLVLTDLYMPGKLDGVDLVQHVARLAPPRPAVVAMSGAPNIAYRASLSTARHVGADATFVKADDPQGLVKIIRSLLDKRGLGGTW